MAKKKVKTATTPRPVGRYTAEELRDRSYMRNRATTIESRRGQRNRLECRGTKAGRLRSGS